MREQNSLEFRIAEPAITYTPVEDQVLYVQAVGHDPNPPLRSRSAFLLLSTINAGTATLSAEIGQHGAIATIEDT